MVFQFSVRVWKVEEGSPIPLKVSCWGILCFCRHFLWTGLPIAGLRCILTDTCGGCQDLEFSKRPLMIARVCVFCRSPTACSRTKAWVSRRP